MEYLFDIWWFAKIVNGISHYGYDVRKVVDEFSDLESVRGECKTYRQEISALKEQGNVFVTDFNNHRIQKFDGNGTFITSWSSQGSADGQFNKPDGISIENSSGIV